MLPKRQYSFQDVNQEQFTPPQLKRVYSVTDKINDDSVYQLIFTHNVIKQIEITSINKEKDNYSLHKKHIVNYVIEIRTDYFDYQVQRRYKQFLYLHEQLKPKYDYHDFPTKKLFKPNKSEVVEERKKLLQKFLQNILNQLPKLKSQEFLKFIEIKEQFLKRGFNNIKLTGLSGDQLTLDQLLDMENYKYQPQNDVEQAIIQFFDKLNNRRNDRGKIIHQLENYLFGKMQCVSLLMLEYMFIGDCEQNICGLIQMVSQDIELHMQCNIILGFIQKLMEFDYNPFAQIAIKAFCELSIKQIKQMKLHQHIKYENSQYKCHWNALKVLNKYINNNHDLDEKCIKFLIDDNDAYDIYNQFKQYLQHSKHENSRGLDSSEECLIITGASTQDTIRKLSSKEMIILEDDNTAEFLIKISQLHYDWKLVKQYKNCSLSHLQGQIIKNQYLLENNNINYIYNLFTESKKWRSSFKYFEILQKFNENSFIAIEKFLWTIKSSFQTVVFISHFQIIEKNENKIEFSVSFLKNYSPCQLTNIKKNEIFCTKVSYVKIEKIERNKINVITMTNLIDQEQKNHILPQLLNEDNSFEKQIDILLTML